MRNSLAGVGLAGHLEVPMLFARRLLPFTALFLFASACSSTPTNPGEPPATDAGHCARPCGSLCCPEGQSCSDGVCKPPTCTPQCPAGSCGDDGCGHRCTCPDGDRCDEQTRRCTHCEPETDQQICDRLGYRCGPGTTTDNCDEPRTVNCGRCEGDATCDAARHECVTPCHDTETEQEFCHRQHVVCGPAEGLDTCNQPRTVAHCGACDDDGVCLPSGQCCTPETEAAICASQHKLCGPANVVDQCGQTRHIASCGDCPGELQCNVEFYCSVPGVPLNDTCAHPQAIALDASGQASVRGDTDGAADSLPRGAANCSASGPDVVYQLDLASASDVELTLSFDDPDVFGALEVRRTCDDPSSKLRCRPTMTGPQTLKLWNVAAGPLYVWVDAAQLPPSVSGPFGLTVTVSSPRAVANDLCAGATDLTFTNDVAIVSGDTAWANDDYDSGTCNAPLDGGDLVYTFTLSEDAAVTLTLARDAGDTFYEPGFYLRGQCTTSTEERGCSRLTTLGAIQPLRIGSLPAGQWSVVVDGQRGTYGPFTLTVVRGAAAPDTCPLAQMLTFDTNNEALASGDTGPAGNDFAGSCNGGATATLGNDLVYAFTLGDVHDVEVTATPTGSSPWRPAVYLRSACAVAASEAGCAAATASGATARLVANQLAAGTWYLVVDGYWNSDHGPFNLKVTWSDPVVVPNDSCAGPTPLAVGNGPVTAHGDTSFAADDYAGSCRLGAGRDVVYAFTLGDPAWVTARVTRDAASPTFQPAVYIRKRDCLSAQAADEMACAAANTSGVATAEATNLAPAAYFVVVDGLNGTSGAFELEVTTRTPIDNDTCATAKVLTLDLTGYATASSDTTRAAGNYTPANPCRGSANDLVYAFDLATDKAVEVTVTPLAPSYKPAVWLRTDCLTTPASELACAYNDTGGPAVAAIPRAQAGRYYVIVDGSNGTNGPFTVEVQATTPISANDTCATPEPLVFDLNGRVEITGETKNNDYTASTTTGCGTTALAGGDVVYSFTLTSDAYVAAQVTRDASTSLQPALYLRKTNCASPADEVFCAKYTSNFPAPTMPARKLAAGTYYLIVDGISASTSGRFTLVVESSINTNCTQARTLSFDSNGVASARGDTRLGTNDDEAPSWCPATRTTNEDLVYAFTLATAQQVAVTVTPASGSNLKPTVYLRSTCDQLAAQVGTACNEAASKGAAVSMTIPRLAGGTYYLWVDSTGSTGVAPNKIPNSGPFTLTVTTSAPATAPANDTCGGVIDLGLSAAVTHASIPGDTTNATDSGTGSCRPGIAGDVVYSFTLANPQKVTATLSRTTNSNMMIYLRDSCDLGAPPHEMACSWSYLAKATAPLTVNQLGAGTWYLWVDGWEDLSAGPFTLTVDTEPPAATVYDNEGCHSPAVLSFNSSDFATDTATTVGATSDSPGGVACATWTNAPDLAYTFTIRTDQRATATVTPAPGSSTFKPALYLRRACDSLRDADEVACATAPAAGGTATVDIKRLDAGTYFLWVDGATSSASDNSGAFTVSVQLAPVAPLATNDRCVGAMNIPALGTLIPGQDTSQAMPDYGWGPFAGACGPNSSEPAADLVYAFTPSTTGTFTVTVTPTGTWSPTVWVTPICGDESACIAYGSGSAPTATFAGNAGTTYYLIVGALLRSNVGVFSIKVQ